MMNNVILSETTFSAQVHMILLFYRLHENVIFLQARCAFQIELHQARMKGLEQFLERGCVAEEDHRKPTIPVNEAT